MKLFCLLVGFGVLLGGERVELRLQGPRSKDTKPFLVRAFASFPQEVLSSRHELEVLDARGRSCPADLIPTARWKDGSIRHLTVRAVVQARMADQQITLSPRRGPSHVPSGIRCRDDEAGGRIEIDTGPLIATFSPRSPGLVAGLVFQGRSFLPPRGGMDLEINLDGSLYRSLPPRQVLLQRGQAEAGVIVMGNTVSPYAGQGPSYVMRLCFTAGTGRIHGSIEVSGRATEGYSEGVRMYLDTSALGSKPKIRIGGLERGGAVSPRTHDGFRLTAASGSTGYTCRGEEKTLPLKGQAHLFLEGRGRRLDLGLPGFGLLHPWSASLTSARGLCLSLLADAFQWEEGFAVEREFILQLGGASRRSEPPAAIGPVRAAAFGLAGLGTGLPFNPPAEPPESDPLYGLYLEVGSELRKALKQEQARWDGVRDFGDYRLPFGHFANCEFDPAYGLLKRFLLTGVLEDLAQAEVMLKHWRRYDCTGPDDDKYAEGLPWVHGLDHRTGRIEAGHMWVDGALLFGLLTGEKAWIHSACAMGRYLTGARPGEGDPPRERCAAWSLQALCALDEAGMPGFREAMNRSAAALRGRQAKTGYFRFDRCEEGTVPVDQVNAWVTSGITMEGLYRHFHRTLDPRSLEAVIRAANWLEEACLDPITGRWYQNLCYRADREGSLVKRQGTVTGEDAAFLALGLARAGHLSGDQRFVNLARGALTEGLRRIKARPPRYPGRALSVILRTAPDVILTTRAFESRR